METSVSSLFLLLTLPHHKSLLSRIIALIMYMHTDKLTYIAKRNVLFFSKTVFSGLVSISSNGARSIRFLSMVVEGCYCGRQLQTVQLLLSNQWMSIVYFGTGNWICCAKSGIVRFVCRLCLLERETGGESL